MSAPASRCRRRWPTLSTRTMDLLGVGADGNLYVWSHAKQVQPLDRFPMEGGRIVGGHYVIQRGAAAITAYIGNSAMAGQVVVQYMCGGLPTLTTSRKAIEPMILGKYVPDPKQQAAILAMLQQLTTDAVASQTAPHRKRGAA